MAQTKAQLEELVREYREENTDLRTQLEVHGTPHNFCDDVTDFFDDITEFVKTQYSALVS